MMNYLFRICVCILARFLTCSNLFIDFIRKSCGSNPVPLPRCEFGDCCPLFPLPDEMTFGINADVEAYGRKIMTRTIIKMKLFI